MELKVLRRIQEGISECKCKSVPSEGGVRSRGVVWEGAKESKEGVAGYVSRSGVREAENSLKQENLPGADVQ